ncbi:hypothetical protein [Candidatus Enterococcus huntleyi]|uniref:hypothetical protein n=1 Tax=Candidatus Enterococcus huntleyi TaxID=1857217 RepID=UPI001379A711|nr:hypothetical protein [Enterococcus sp. JM4C]
MNLGQEWIHVIVESFFAGGLFPLLAALTLPFKLDASYLWLFVPACLFIYLVKGLAQNRSIRPEKNNSTGLSLWVVACLLVVLQGINRGLIQGVILLLLIAVYFVLYKRFRYSNYKQYSLSVLLLLGTILLY